MSAVAAEHRAPEHAAPEAGSGSSAVVDAVGIVAPPRAENDFKENHNHENRDQKSKEIYTAFFFLYIRRFRLDGIAARCRNVFRIPAEQVLIKPRHALFRAAGKEAAEVLPDENAW